MNKGTNMGEISSEDLMQKVAPHWYSRRANDDPDTYYMDYVVAFGAWLHVHVINEGSLHSMKWTDYRFETWLREETTFQDSEMKSLFANKSIFVKRAHRLSIYPSDLCAAGHRDYNKYLLLA